MEPAFHKFDLDFLVELDDESQLYNQLSDNYNDVSQGFYAKANLELLERLNIRQDSKMLDLACATGHLAIEMAKRAPLGKVVGVDLASDMIAKARIDAKAQQVHNIEFVLNDINHFLPTVKPGDFQIGVSCFVMSYLGSEFLLRAFRELLGPHGQVGVTTNSLETLSEWHPLFFELVSEFGSEMSQFEVSSLPDLPFNEDDLKNKIEMAGFKNPKSKTYRVPLEFPNSEEALISLISSGWISGYFYKVRDKKIRRRMLNWLLKKIDEQVPAGSSVKTSFALLIGWNEP